MDSVCVIPEDAEVLCRRFQSCKAVDGFIGIGDALRIGILRNAPDPLDGRVGAYQLFDNVHVGAGMSHRHVHHFDSEIFRNGKVSVITWNRAQKFYFVQLAPGSAA